MKTAITTIVASLLAASPALAQYKCVINGKTVYADAPCAPDARHVGELQDQVTDDQQDQRLRQSIKERQERNRIERRENAEYAEQQRAAARHAAAEEIRAANAESARRQRCANLEHDMKWNQRGVARYQDFGWQRQLTQQEQEFKQNREAYDRECRK